MRIRRKPGYRIIEISDEELTIYAFCLIAPFSWINFVNDFSYSKQLEQFLSSEFGLLGDLLSLAVAIIGFGGLVVPILGLVVFVWTLFSRKMKRGSAEDDD